NITIQTTASNVKKDSWIVAFVEGAKKGEIVFGKKEMAGIVWIVIFPELVFMLTTFKFLLFSFL
ncbi:hypothetical protein, partial [Mycoplasmopsis bovis]|uniref:hypothetical protein n=1 Tax=Mycoplasmopsis bovis TaxID=28903 RepID=UPI003D2807A5